MLMQDKAAVGVVRDFECGRYNMEEKCLEWRQRTCTDFLFYYSESREGILELFGSDSSGLESPVYFVGKF